MDRKQQLTRELFSRAVKSFPRVKIYPKYIDECWSIDLIDKSALSKYNDGYKFIFTIIDNFSKYAWAIPIKNKSGKSIVSAFQDLLVETKNRKPKRLWGDKGPEFYNKDFLKCLKDNNIELYSTNSELKAVFVERFNRSLLDLIKEPMFIEGQANWVNHLPKALNIYNKRKHGTIKISPIDASKKENSSNVLTTFINRNTPNSKPPKFHEGDFVRLQDKRKIFSKGYTTKWGPELFKINKIIPTNPITYLVEDVNKEVIEGKFYTEELLLSQFNFKTNKETLKSMNIVLGKWEKVNKEISVKK